jgi:hypothetical protein
MYEKGSSIRVNVDISESGVRELEFIGEVVIDASDFMAVKFDTIIIPKMDIKNAEPLPDSPLEEVLGVQETTGAAAVVERPKPPEVENVRFLPVTPKRGSKGR